MAGSDAGTVVLGCIQTIAPFFLPPRVASLFASHHGVQLRIVEEVTSVLLTQLQEGAMDLALVALPVPGAEWESRELLRDPLFVAVPKNHPLAREKSASLGALDPYSFLLLKEGHCLRDTVISACQRSNLKPNVIFETGQFSTILGLVAAGMGLSIVPQMAVAPVKGCRFIPIDDLQAFRRLGLVRLRSHFQTRAEALLVEHLANPTVTATR
jgi:LysR family transcriptional regulator, hydrogen peroxide-inducible genes activator